MVQVRTDTIPVARLGFEFPFLPYANLKWSEALVSKRKPQSSPDVERSSKKQKVASEHSLPATDTAKELVECDTLDESVTAQQSPMRVDDRITLDASFPETFMQDLEAVLKNAELSAWSHTGGQDSTLSNSAAGATADVTTSLDPDLALVQQPTDCQVTTEDQLAADENNEVSFESLLYSEVMSQPTVSHHPEGVIAPQASEGQVGIHSFPTKPSCKSHPVSQAMHSPPKPTPSRPIASHEIIRDYQKGWLLPNSYLTKLRRQVDATFSNDHWGDEHYFSSESSPFRYFEDYRRDPHQKSDDRALDLGLKLCAARIPQRTVRGSWKSFEETITGLDPDIMGSTEEEDDEAVTPTLEEMQRRIQARIEATQPVSIPHDLEPEVQQQKIFINLKAMQIPDFAMLVAPGTHPCRVAIPPPISRSGDSGWKLRTQMLALRARLQQRVKEIGTIRDGKLKASAWGELG
jgi:hypothetical protein